LVGGRKKEKGFRHKAHGAWWKDKGFLKWEVGPVVVPGKRDYAAASMRKSEKEKDD
jgi:hypothetical protein